MILLRKGMILEVNILEISTEKGCPLNADDWCRESGPTMFQDFYVYAYL